MILSLKIGRGNGIHTHNLPRVLTVFPESHRVASQNSNAPLSRDPSCRVRTRSPWSWASQLSLVLPQPSDDSETTFPSIFLKWGKLLPSKINSFPFFSAIEPLGIHLKETIRHKHKDFLSASIYIAALSVFLYWQLPKHPMVHSFLHLFNEYLLSTQHRTNKPGRDRALSLTEQGSNASMDHSTCTEWITMPSLKMICSEGI